MAEFYGINPFALSGPQLLALAGHLPRLEARRLRRDLRVRPEIKLSAEGIKELVRAETGSEEAAEEAFQRAALAELREEANQPTE